MREVHCKIILDKKNIKFAHTYYCAFYYVIMIFFLIFCGRVAAF
jgi:hypothetical protein